MKAGIPFFLESLNLSNNEQEIDDQNNGDDFPVALDYPPVIEIANDTDAPEWEIISDDGAVIVDPVDDGGWVNVSPETSESFEELPSGESDYEIVDGDD